MSISGNINDKQLGILGDGIMNVRELSSGAKATGNINDLTHGSIIESAGAYFINVKN